LRLKRKDDFVVTATMDGYQPAEAEVHSRMRAGGGTALAGNAIFGGIVGGVVDASNGSLNDLRPNPLHITMIPVGGAAPVAASQTTPGEAPAGAPAETAAAPSGAPQSE